MRRAIVPLSLVLAVGALAACGGGSNDATATILVPEDFATIQAAVDAADPGDLVLISPGTYEEAVDVETPRIVIRGLDRNTVILDGDDRLANGFSVEAGGVAIENLTVRRYQQNGILFNGAYEEDGSLDPAKTYGAGDDVLLGYRASYVTAHNNGLYGIYAFAARGGLIEHVYASGHPDSGVYVGQCKPCNVVITDATAELNAIGYYGTNASGGVYIIDSVFRNNRLGMTPNSQDQELLAPQIETVVAGNLVVDNADPDAPNIARGFFGGGIAIGGGTANTIVKNRVSGHPAFGIGVLPLGDYEPERNTVLGNVLEDNGVDLAYLAAQGTVTTKGNCFAGNSFTTSVPAGIETAMPCPGADRPLEPASYELPAAPPGVDYRAIPAPAAQPTMPDAATAPPSSASSTPPAVDVDAIVVPAAR
ncbi:MAG: right-handed parallel beta-helix repeat-containing protein [Acidimicrobiia bacterium]